MHVQGGSAQGGSFLRQTFRQSTLQSQQAEQLGAAQRMTNTQRSWPQESLLDHPIIARISRGAPGAIARRRGPIQHGLQELEIVRNRTIPHRAIVSPPRPSVPLVPPPLDVEISVTALSVGAWRCAPKQ